MLDRYIGTSDGFRAVMVASKKLNIDRCKLVFVKYVDDITEDKLQVSVISFAWYFSGKEEATDAVWKEANPYFRPLI